MGSTEGVPVPTGKGGFQKREDGRIVLTRLDEPLLTRMAVATGGTYVRSVAGDMDLDRIYQDRIRGAMSDATMETGRKRIWADRYQWPLAMGVLLLLAAFAIPGSKKVPVLPFLLAVMLGMPPHPVVAGPLQEGYDAYRKEEYDTALKHFLDGQVDQPDDPHVLYNIGNAFYKTGQYENAYTYYSRALANAPEPLKEKVLYNMGNTAYRRQALQEAIKNYEAALAIDPDDEEAKANLAFVRDRLEQQQRQSKSDAAGQQGGQETPPEPSGQSDRQSPDDPSAPSGPQAQNDRDQTQMNGDHQQPSPRYGSEKQKDQHPRDRSTQGATQGESAGTKEAGQPTSQAATQMLNRLKDEPGRAMMPNYRKRTVEKDW